MAAKLQNPPAPAFSFPSPAAAASVSLSSNNPYANNGIAPSHRAKQQASHNSHSSQASNPFRTPKHTPQTSESSNNYVLSPISPIEEERKNPFRQAPSQAAATSARATRMSTTEPRKSTDLRKLDGTPYPGREDGTEAKPRQVKVAQDMYEGDMPPGYDSENYQGPLAEKGHKHAAGSECHKCGGHKRGPSVDAVGSGVPAQAGRSECRKCGGQRSTPPSSFPQSAMGGARAAPSQGGPRTPHVQSSEAGPSSATHARVHSCGKCGRRKRPESMSTNGSPPQHNSAQSRGVPLLQTNGMPMVGINVEPPTAISEHPPGQPFSSTSTNGQNSSLQQKNDRQKQHKPSRTGSVSSLFRSLSRRKKSSEAPTPREGENGSYARLRPDDYVERPGSPFSFVDKPQEEQTFEMNDLRKSKLPERRNSWDKADENTGFLATEVERPKYSRSQSTNTGIKPPGAEDDIFLALPADQRPGVTRFKSLRYGVNNVASGLSRSASQIGRSTSLRRLESVKKVPQFWYRNDMAIEGASSEYNNYAY